MNADGWKDVLSRACDRYGVPGAQLGWVRGDERGVVCAGRTSVTDGGAVTPESSFHAGSIAKSLAGLVVTAAARRGEIDLDVPCADQAEGLWPDTPRELMAQTTGRPNLLPEPEEPIEDFVARVLQLPRVHAPGRFSYCNAGWSVLDALLRRRCGATFEELATAAWGAVITFGEPDGAAQGHAALPDGSVRQVPPLYAASASAAGSRWWATTDQLLDYATLHLNGGAGRFHPDDVALLQTPQVVVPGATISDAWGLGWALWDRGDHHAFGWAGYTSGHRAYLRCYPEQKAAVVLMANSAGPLFGPPGGSALFDAILPAVLETLEVPPLPLAELPEASRPTEVLAGTYGPVQLLSAGEDGLVLLAGALGERAPIPHHRVGGDVFVADDEPLGGMPIAVDGDLLYLGPFALPRS